jgi:hypothetical protein
MRLHHALDMIQEWDPRAILHADHICIYRPKHQVENCPAPPQAVYAGIDALRDSPDGLRARLINGVGPNRHAPTLI